MNVNQRNRFNAAMALLLILGIALIVGGIIIYEGVEEEPGVAPEEMYYQGFYDSCMVFMIRIQEVDRQEALINCDKVTKGIAENGMHRTAQEEPDAMKRWQRIWQIEDGLESA